MKMNLHALSVRHGQIEDGPYWAKVNIISDEVENVRGFSGQRVIEYPVDADSAKKISDKLTGTVPANFDFLMTVKPVSGKPTLIIESLV